MRLSPETGKEDCRIIDFVDSAARVSGVVSTPSLFGLDPSEVIDGTCMSWLDVSSRARMTLYVDESTESLEERRDQHEDPIMASRPDTKDEIPEPTSVTYTDYEDPFSFVDQSSGAPQIRKLSNYAWVGCGDDIYVLECLGKGYIRVEPVKSKEGGSAENS